MVPHTRRMYEAGLQSPSSRTTKENETGHDFCLIKRSGNSGRFAMEHSVTLIVLEIVSAPGKKHPTLAVILTGSRIQERPLVLVHGHNARVVSSDESRAP